ncbi:hypothetical protein [Deinococcus sp. NW-56]|uniref:hypothetical protein n=1 Tax=Deinococcus sp. NW-56 TaxID=2080419 RepID=UPI000CF3F299|nr:hypothetical protein [Deinococcus sp. NW-56]
MNANTKILALMAALAAGSALAEGTPSGTAITNTATATFTDPATNQPATPVQSNTVSTTVLPKPDFDIVYRDLTDGTVATTTPLPAGYEVEVLPGGEITTAYYVQNNGNVNNYVVGLAANTTGTPNAPAGVLYFLDTNKDGILGPNERTAGPVTQVTVPVDDPSTTQDEGVVSIIQVIQVPGNAAAGSEYAASPQGTADVFAAGTVAPRTEAAGDLQYSRAKLYTPQLTNNVIDGDGTTPGQQNPPTTVTPPGGTTPVPGYTDPTRPTTNIVAISGDLQVAYPKADGDNIDDTVVFVNSLTNGGTRPDAVRLFPTDQTGQGRSPIGTLNPDGSFTLPGGVTVRFTDAAGNSLPLGEGGYPTLTVDAGKTVNYRTVVTYPDYDSDPASDPAPISIIIGADSGNDGGLETNDTSTNTVYPPQLQFGDATPALGSTPTPAPVQTVVPGAPAGTGTGANTDSSAVFPMDVANTGAYADTYTLTGTVSVPVANANGTVTNQTVNVRYFIDTNSDGQPDTALPSAPGAGSTVVYTTPVVTAGTELKVFAVVDVPANAQATTLNGVTTLLTVNQSVTATYSGITRPDNNDQIAVTSNAGGVALTKSEPASARPGETLSYTITAKNNFNAALKNFYVTESNANPSTNVFTFTTFASVSATKTFTDGTVLYRFNGGSWQSSTIPATGTTVTSVDVGVDTNSNGTVDGNDLFPAQGQLNITFNVTIK